MNPLDLHDLLLWSTIVAIVILTVITGRMVNRFLTYRAHRRALAELRRRAMAAGPLAEQEYSPLPLEVRTKA